MEPNEVAVIPSTIRLASLTALIAASAPFHAMTIALYQNPITLTPNVSLADLTVATFDGYAPVVGLAWNSPYIDVDGSALVFGASQTIVATGNTTPNTIYGYYGTDSGVTTLKVAWAFAAPVGVSDVGQAVSFVPALRYSGT